MTAARTRVAEAFVNDPELADGLLGCSPDLPATSSGRSCAVSPFNLQMRALGEGAFVLALADALECATDIAPDDVARAHGCSKPDARA
jgi:hypothetical protein